MGYKKSGEPQNLTFISKPFNETILYEIGYVFEKICYISDCNNIDKKNYKHLKGLRYLIIDCLRIKKHPSHFNLDEAVKISNFLNPKKTILTNLHVDFDYKTLKKNDALKYYARL